MNKATSIWVWLVRFGFRLLYNEMAWSYDWVSWAVSMGEWQKWIRVPLQFVDGRSSQTILEIGHGPGHLLAELERAGHLIVGLDRSPYMGRRAARRLDGLGASSRLVRGSVQSLPFAPDSFDWVISTFPTDYIIYPETLHAIKRVLRNNGCLLVVPEGHLTQSGLLQSAIEWLYRITGQRGGPFEQVSEEILWRPFIERFEQAGFHTRVEVVSFSKSEATILVASSEEQDGRIQLRC